MSLTAAQLSRAAGLPLGQATAWLPHINGAAWRASIVNAPRWAMWLAQIGHESGGFARLVESLDYTPDALMRTWPSRYTHKLAELHGRGAVRANQKAIAMHVYGGRMGNRPGTDDGWKYRGRGLIQVTGRDNYRACGEALGLPLLAQPELLQEPEHAAMSAAWFWALRSLNAAADMRDVERATRAINGGINGLADRQARYRVACSALGVML